MKRELAAEAFGHVAVGDTVAIDERRYRVMQMEWHDPPTADEEAVFDGGGAIVTLTLEPLAEADSAAPEKPAMSVAMSDADEAQA